MKIVSLSYTNTSGYQDPEKWLLRIDFYTGVLDQLAIRHAVHSIEQINYQGALKRNGVQYHFLNFKKAKQYFPGKLHRFIKALQPDVILLNGLIFPLQVIQLRLKLGSAVKIILLHHGEKPFKGMKRVIQKMAGTCVDAYLFTSAGFGKEWVGNGIIRHQHKIYEVIQASSVFVPQNKMQSRAVNNILHAVVFLWVGRLDANKDPITVVKAFIQFARLQPEAVLYMIYQTEELLNEIHCLIQDSPAAASSIKLVGKVEHRELQNWYSAADFIVSGSHHEGSGIAVCEAMSCGCIPVLTDIVSFRGMTGAGKCGFLYKPGDTVSLLQALAKTSTLNLEDERNKTIQQFKNELSFEAVAGKIEQVIKSVTKQDRH